MPSGARNVRSTALRQAQNGERPSASARAASLNMDVRSTAPQADSAHSDRNLGHVSASGGRMEPVIASPLSSLPARPKQKAAVAHAPPETAATYRTSSSRPSSLSAASWPSAATSAEARRRAES
eukprot:2668823-Prymnesium_polylepis.2